MDTEADKMKSGVRMYMTGKENSGNMGGKPHTINLISVMTYRTLGVTTTNHE